MKTHELERDAVLSRIGNIITAPKTKDGKSMNAETAAAAVAAGTEVVYDDSAVIISDNQVRLGKGFFWCDLTVRALRFLAVLSHRYMDRSTASLRFRVPLSVSLRRL